MRGTAVLLIFVACVGHARRLHSLRDHVQRNPSGKSDDLPEIVAIEENSQYAQSSRSMAAKSRYSALRAVASLFLALGPTGPASAFQPSDAGSNPLPEYTVRLAARRDLLPASALVESAFSVDSRYGGKSNSTSGVSKRNWWEAPLTRIRVALDLEQRMTPWDWCHHAQIVAEEVASGRILGFAEVWGEDRTLVNNESTTSPQPVLLNLCVSSKARRLGVAKRLLAKCEEEVGSWGDGILYLKVRDDNSAACTMYESQGFELLQVLPVSKLSPWRDRWKGGAMPLRLMRKSISKPLTSTRLPRKVFNELEVSLQSVLAYNDPDAFVWFALLVLRNVGSLSPEYSEFISKAVRELGVLAGWIAVGYIASHWSELYASVQSLTLTP